MRMMRNLIASETGASIIELALVAPFLAALVVVVSDLSGAYSMKLRLEQVSQRTLERLQQMSSPADPANQATIASEGATAATDAGYSGASVAVTYTNYCNGALQTNYTDTCTSGQTQMKYVNVTIGSSYTPMFSNTYFPNRNSNGSVNLTGVAGMRVQ
jgi:Flp pilus assembly protein TadG